MALKSIAEAPGDSASLDEYFITSSTRIFQAYTDPTDTAVSVITSCGHGIKEAHPSMASLYVTKISPKRLRPQCTYPGDGTLASLWEITLEYGPWNPLTHWPSGNPLNKPVFPRFEVVPVEIAAFEDVDGEPIVNSAGDPYDPPLMRYKNRLKIIVERNESISTFSLSTILALSNTVNVATWNGFPAKTVHLLPIKMPELAYAQSVNLFYFPITYEFEVDYDTWVKQVLNAGFRQLDSSGNLTPILINGLPATTPVPLDESGHAILHPSYTDGSGDVPPDSSSGGESGWPSGGGEPPSGGTGLLSGDLVVNAYDLIRTTDFSALHMDSLFTLPSY